MFSLCHAIPHRIHRSNSVQPLTLSNASPLFSLRLSQAIDTPRLVGFVVADAEVGSLSLTLTLGALGSFACRSVRRERLTLPPPLKRHKRRHPRQRRVRTPRARKLDHHPNLSSFAQSHTHPSKTANSKGIAPRITWVLPGHEFACLHPWTQTFYNIPHRHPQQWYAL